MSTLKCFAIWDHWGYQLTNILWHTLWFVFFGNYFRSMQISFKADKMVLIDRIQEMKCFEMFSPISGLWRVYAIFEGWHGVDKILNYSLMTLLLCTFAHKVTLISSKLRNGFVWFLQQNMIKITIVILVLTQEDVKRP